MGKFWRKVDDFFGDYPELAIVTFFLVLFLFTISVIGICFLNVEFWSYQIPTNDCLQPSFWGCSGETQPNLHGFGAGQHLFFSIIIIEIFFLLFCILIKRGKEESSWLYALKNKIYALGIWAIIYYLLIPFIWLLGVIPYLSIFVGLNKFFSAIGNIFLVIWKPALCVVGVIALVGLFYLINVGLSKLFERKE